MGSVTKAHSTVPEGEARASWWPKQLLGEGGILKQAVETYIKATQIFHVTAEELFWANILHLASLNRYLSWLTFLEMAPITFSKVIC